MKIQLDQKAFDAWFNTMDKEAQIELSANIIDKFAHSYLKPLLTKDIKSDIAASIRRELFDSTGYGRNTLNKELLADIKADIRASIREELSKIKNEEIQFFQENLKSDLLKTCYNEKMSTIAYLKEKESEAEKRIETYTLAAEKRLEDGLKNFLFKNMQI